RRLAGALRRGRARADAGGEARGGGQRLLGAEGEPAPLGCVFGGGGDGGVARHVLRGRALEAEAPSAAFELDRGQHGFGIDRLVEGGEEDRIETVRAALGDEALDARRRGGEGPGDGARELAADRGGGAGRDLGAE